MRIKSHADQCLLLTDQCLLLTDQCLLLTDQCLLLTDQCLSLTDQCLLLTDQCLSLTDQCLSLTDQCLLLADFRTKMGKFSQLEAISGQNRQKSCFSGSTKRGWSKIAGFGRRRVEAGKNCLLLPLGSGRLANPEHFGFQVGFCARIVQPSVRSGLFRF
ncbi:MAG TPA: hypothetical protein VMB22_01525 [Verrucomicrobiae bacterium]|nr:hypothetical protein [Verrucomicrobiae bacterium]